MGEYADQELDDFVSNDESWMEDEIHDMYKHFTCDDCGWSGEGIALTEDGECPKCYALLSPHTGR